MTSDLFDKSLEYDTLLQRGLSLTGEDKAFFMRARVRDLKAQLAATGAPAPQRILDFGCGIGDCVAHLAQEFPDAEVVGVDTAVDAIRYAAAQHGSPRIKFVPLYDFTVREAFDLCHCSGVFHHIQPAQRAPALDVIGRALRPGGRFVLVENNPWNPGTRLVMSRIAFDADASPLNVREAQRLLRANGFVELVPPRFLFWFPRWLSALRVLEPHLVHIPFGGQYYLLAMKQRDQA